ncbi:MAG TPA: SDR family oxidoreductase [Dyella sp.]|nr:SDR family oxidoreductase [Dyella sp.]
MDDAGIGDALAQKLHQAQHTVITVRFGTRYEQSNNTEFVLPDASEAHFEELFGRLATSGIHLDHMVHMRGLDDLDEQAMHEFAGFERRQEQGYFNLLFALKALTKWQRSGTTLCHVVTSDAYRVTGEESVGPETATMAGLCKVAPQEHAHLRCRHIDLARCEYLEPTTGSSAERLADCLFEEAQRQDTVVAYRRGHRWIPSYVPQNHAPRGPGRFRHGGVYVITGGLGRLGMVIASYLAATYAARLVLIARPGSQEPSEGWHELEASGAQVVLCRADVTDAEQMEHAFHLAEERFGVIDGVIHAAGQLRDVITPLVETTVNSSRAQFMPKVQGLLVLDALLRHRQVDFCLLMSSLSAVLGGLGFAAYAAANSYMDAFVHHKHGQGETFWLSVNWDGWLVDDVSELTGVHGMRLAEGMQAMEWALSVEDIPQLVQATGDLHRRLEKWIDLRSVEADQHRLYARADALGDRLAPRNDVEHRLQGLWQELIGIDGIGVNEDFFELGGDSLLATRLLNRIRDAFPDAGYSMRAFFEAPTIASGAEKISTSLLAQKLEEKKLDVMREQDNIEEGEFQ